MSQFKVEVVPVKLEKHPDADLLSIATVKGWQCVVKTSDFDGVELGAYIPLDSILPPMPEWEYMQSKKYRVRTIRLRGILSQGILIPAKEGWVEGQDVTEELGIKKWIPPEERQEKVIHGGVKVPEPAKFCYHTDIERIQNFPNAFKEGDEVIITEKIHGTNCRFGWTDGQYMVGSHTCRKECHGVSIYARIGEELDMEHKFSFNLFTKENNDLVLYGEIYGFKVQKKFNYGLETQKFILFDVQLNGVFLEWEEVEGYAKIFNLDLPPVLYKGPFSNKVVEELVNGLTVLGQGAHLKEGIVIRSIHEEWDERLGRKWIKKVSDEYLLKKGG
ncbi:MAG: hypothetical protein KAW92_10485 [Candidatus Cloacimonetes bacterium]|nr:hypothetical protein [Candidatus Cloacimonadota bacterium]